MWRYLTAHHSLGEELKQVADAASIGIALGSIVGMLPALAALITIIWTGIRIWETRTVQRFIHGDKK